MSQVRATRGRSPRPSLPRTRASGPPEVRRPGGPAGLPRLGHRSDDPAPLLLQTLERLTQVTHPGHRQILEGPGRRPDDMGGQPRRLVPRHQHPMDPQRLGRPEQIPHVSGILDLVQGQEQGRLAPVPGTASRSSSSAYSRGATRATTPW